MFIRTESASLISLQTWFRTRVEIIKKQRETLFHWPRFLAEKLHYIQKCWIYVDMGHQIVE